MASVSPELVICYLGSPFGRMTSEDIVHLTCQTYRISFSIITWRGRRRKSTETIKQLLQLHLNVCRAFQFARYLTVPLTQYISIQQLHSVGSNVATTCIGHSSYPQLTVILESIKGILDYPSAMRSKLKLAQTSRVLVQEHTAGHWGTGTWTQGCPLFLYQATSFMLWLNQAMFKQLLDCNKCPKISTLGKKIYIFSNSNTVNFVFLT